MSLLCLIVCVLRVPNIMSLGICFKNCTSWLVCTFAWNVKICVIFSVQFKRRKE